MGEDHGVQLVERQRFWSVEERHGVVVVGHVDANIDHDSGFVGGDKVAGATNLAVGAQRSNTGPSVAWSGGTVNVQTEILQEFPAFVSVGLAVHANVMNGFGKQVRGPFNFHCPAGLVPYGVAVFTSPTDGRAGLLALNRNFPVARIEIHLGDFGLLGDNLLNNLPCFVHFHHGIDGRSKDNFSLDAPGNFSDQPVGTSERSHVGCNDGDITRLQVNLVFDVPWDDFSNLVFQFFVGHSHDVHPAPAVVVDHKAPFGAGRRGRGKMNFTSEVWKSRLEKLVGTQNRA